MKNIYKHNFPIKGLLLMNLLLGISLLSFFAYLFKNEIFPDIWTFAGPLLGLAMVINGLTSSKVREINVHTSLEMVEIIKESVFATKAKKVKLQSLKSELKSENGKKLFTLIVKLRLIILENDKEVEEISSNLFSLNNNKLVKLHSDLKTLYKNN
ncbi:hypothetical protein [Algibacter sp. 2305UL17-15]|uniref:hypothetical protein n=1 Tax=Algibacter sp. 2305UL17-15 TaxID=3231268 RepID=UPI00345AF724